MILYQVKDWDANFENSKSRERIQCSFVCVPNKQHGMSFSKIMAEKDGAMIYGIWQLMLGACSQQKKPRNGWMTQDGYQTGTPWVPEDLALKFRRPVSEIKRSLQVLTSEEVAWIITHEIEGSTRQVPAKYPLGIVKEEKEENEKNKEALNIPINLSSNPKFNETWERWIEYRKKGKAVKNWINLFQNQLVAMSEWGADGSIQSMKLAILNGWQSIYPPKTSSATSKSSSKPISSSEFLNDLKSL